MLNWPVQKSWREWLGTPGEFLPLSFITLTFRDSEISVEKSWGLVKKFIHEINYMEIGPKYKSRFKHSYFSYFITAEYQKRGTIHYHMLVDNYVNYRFAIKTWYEIAGLINIKRISDSKGAVRYALKYVTKSEIEPVYWKVRNKYVKPDFINLLEVE